MFLATPLFINYSLLLVWLSMEANTKLMLTAADLILDSFFINKFVLYIIEHDGDFIVRVRESAGKFG